MALSPTSSRGSSGGNTTAQVVASGKVLPTADPTTVTVDTTTYNNPLSGVGKLTTLVFPGYTVGLAFAVQGDAFPRLLVGSENDMYAGDGTFDSYNTVGGGLIFKFGTGVHTKVGFNSTYWGASEDGYEFFDAGNADPPPDANIGTNIRVQWYDGTAGSPRLRFKQKDSGGTLTSGITEVASPLTSGALPTATLSSGTGAQLLASRAVESVTPFTGDGTNNVATCLVQLSPDNVTYSTLDTLSIAAALNLTGVIALAVNLRVPAGWYIKLTASHGTIGTTTYY